MRKASARAWKEFPRHSHPLFARCYFSDPKRISPYPLEEIIIDCVLLSKSGETRVFRVFCNKFYMHYIRALASAARYRQTRAVNILPLRNTRQRSANKTIIRGFSLLLLFSAPDRSTVNLNRECKSRCPLFFSPQATMAGLIGARSKTPQDRGCNYFAPVFAHNTHTEPRSA